MATNRRSSFLLAALATLGSVGGSLAACGGGATPEIDGLPDQIAQVGRELSIEIRATDADGDELVYSFTSDAPNIQSRASITRAPSGAGIFRWTPLAQDVGIWYFDFTASDGGKSDVITVSVDVRSAVGQNSAPIFREPLGTGTTLDLRSAECVDLNILIEDQDSTSVILTQEEPIEGAELMSTGGGLSGHWHWCPSPHQIASEDRYLLVLGADDLSNAPTVKDYLIVLRTANNPDCPGQGPVIEHTATDESTVSNLTIVATISDDLGLKNEPLFYYATTPPPDGTPTATPPMTQLTMELLDGDMQNGVWGADVPNPVAGEGEGTSAQLYYVIVANDNDDRDGTCDHLTSAPATATYQITVENPGGTGDVALCESCLADQQCGGDGALCVRVGASQESFCLQGCTSAADCPVDYDCGDDVTSIDGATAKQCQPHSGDCSNPNGVVCDDDDHEQDDSREQALTTPPIAPALYDLVSCPASSGFGDDEDFFRIVLTESSLVTAEISGDDVSDLDLALLFAEGGEIEVSESLSSDESVSQCLVAGTYYLRVFAFGPQENPYLLDYSRVAQSCATACDDDGEEPDDDAFEARQTTYPVFSSESNAICSGDEDWYEVLLIDGETLTVDLYFTQTLPTEDLDLHFYDDNGIDLTPCSEVAPSTCAVDQGQSAASNEHFEFTVSANGTYDVVVHGWNGSANLYDIEISIE